MCVYDGGVLVMCLILASNGGSNGVWVSSFCQGTLCYAMLC